MGPFLGKMLRTVLLFFSLSSIRGGISEDAWTCRKDYSRPCAEGWHQVNASRECVAPLSYRGPCPRFLQMENKTTKKRLLEGECRIFWPCLDQCERNYSLQCPEQWAPEDEKTCRPLAIYEGTCLPSHDFSNMTDAQKEIWSNKCETDWPCMASCKKDYSRGCPQGWTKEKDGSCYAPVKYSGPCLSRMSLLNVDEDMKVALEKLCNVSFPCVETCDLDMNDPCPTGWFVKSDAFGNALACLPPDNYRGPCGEETKLIGLTNLKSKKRMAYECAVKWPCSSVANLINYEQFCPDGWTKSEQYCVAPHNYVGPCAKKKLFATFERGMKKAYAEECDVEWPLLGKEAPVSYRRGSALRKRKYNIGPVEPFTGAIISGTVK
ncbi:CPW-WPC family protein [Plasmodium knowlesi strain H]|uniref:CPW-WPC family protein n=2 Tax=Plasmodium knowlesi TaxID=5850 RepID=A0A679L6Q1_PLAKH|nr:CPW-WPC family protein [Plasmodium knowlesi strain H]OTN67782.1 putative CPW-WPC family protein [Plasmodium knowlesi]CAA9990330.1 CPW-WPC family protein [Plasmodium knowlesi strain H]VVS79804.1 CPW-WPC family protein [Plasmodium knowlesi strain H]